MWRPHCHLADLAACSRTHLTDTLLRFQRTLEGTCCHGDDSAAVTGTYQSPSSWRLRSSCYEKSGKAVRLLALSSRVILRSESHGTHDHILMSDGSRSLPISWGHPMSWYSHFYPSGHVHLNKADMFTMYFHINPRRVVFAHCWPSTQGIKKVFFFFIWWIRPSGIFTFENWPESYESYGQLLELLRRRISPSQGRYHLWAKQTHDPSVRASDRAAAAVDSKWSTFVVMLIFRKYFWTKLISWKKSIFCYETVKIDILFA
jgi:hypothetical protein